MTALIKSIEDYLYETRRDVFFLELTLPKDDFDEKRFKSDWVKASQRMATEWLEAHQVAWAFTAPPGLLVGWHGHLYIDFSGWDDPRLKAWQTEFETSMGDPKYPERFVLYGVSFEQWMQNGGFARYENNLKGKDLEGGWD
jgi:hypothetical protein